jgi:hypothetical protein
MSIPSATQAGSDSARQLLRHALATVAHRGGKVVREVPAEFSSFSLGSGCMSAGKILAHLSDLLEWPARMAAGDRVWRNSTPQEWEEDVRRFHASLAALDAILASDRPLDAIPLNNLLQGPVADALTHVGQLAMMRRVAGSPIQSENYFAAEIAAGRVGPD